MKKFKVGDYVKTLNPRFHGVEFDNRYIIDHFIDNGKRCYLESLFDDDESSWLIEDSMYLKHITVDEND